MLEDYVNKGGDLIILAGTNLNDNKPRWRPADNLNSYLMQNFGLQFNNNVVIDKTQAFQTPLLPVATNLYGVELHHDQRHPAPVRRRWCSKSPTASRSPTRRPPTSP